MISHSDTFNGSDLVLPLSWHHLGIGARHLDTSVQARSVVGISNDSSEAVVGTNGAVVRALGTWVTIVGPAQRPGSELGLSADKSVLLLDSKPWLLVKASVKNFLGMNSKVCVRWLENLA